MKGLGWKAWDERLGMEGLGSKCNLSTAAKHITINLDIDG